jgi:hypothetical protein
MGVAGLNLRSSEVQPGFPVSGLVDLTRPAVQALPVVLTDGVARSIFMLTPQAGFLRKQNNDDVRIFGGFEAAASDAQ